MKIFCDGVFDLFHYGHVNHFEKIKKLYPDSYLLVGVLKDSDAIEYKRKPIFNQEKRNALVNSCKYVDETTFDYPMIITHEYMKDNDIDLIVHAFTNKKEFEQQYKFFEVPIKENKFVELDYDKRISTTNILNNNYINNPNKENWDLIWEKKGESSIDNVNELDGYEGTDFDPKLSFENIIETLNIKKTDKVLEIGCGAGLLSQFFNDYNYYGIDYSSSLVQKNIKLFNSKVYNCSANNLMFKDKYFDYCFCIGVFEYFPSKDYMKEVIKEMERVAKNTIYILNIRSKTHTKRNQKHKFNGVFQHLVYNKNDHPTVPARYT